MVGVKHNMKTCVISNRAQTKSNFALEYPVSSQINGPNILLQIRSSKITVFLVMMMLLQLIDRQYITYCSKISAR